MAINSSIIFTKKNLPGESRDPLLLWLPIIIGLTVLYLPSLVDLFRGIWSTDQQAHGPIVLSIACWLIYRKWPLMWQRSANKSSAPVAGWLIFIVGLVCHRALSRNPIARDRLGNLVACRYSLARARDNCAQDAMVSALFYVVHDSSSIDSR